MRSFSTSDLSRKSGDVIASALQGPVSIVQRGKPRLIMLSVEEYESLLGQGSRRIAGATSEMPLALAEDVDRALSVFLAGSDA
jgi:prevent-host-death family protein